MTVIRPNSISGVSSITGSGGDISIFRADGTAADVTVNNITGIAVTFSDATFSGTTGIQLPKGTTAQRVNTQASFRYNTQTDLPEYYNGNAWVQIDSPPTVSSVSPTEVASASGGNITFTINGTRFSVGATVKFISNTGQILTASSVTRVSSTQLTAVIAKNSFVNAQEPYDVQVTNATNLSSILANQINVDNDPAWVTSSGSLGSFSNYQSVNVTVSATDSDGDAVTFSIVSGALPSGLSLNASTGAITGTLGAVGSSTTTTFTIRATSNGKTADRSFSFVQTGVGSNVYAGATSAYTWTKPAGLTSIVAYIWGAGGGGGGAENGNTNYGSSGGSGGYAKATIDVSGVSALYLVAGKGGTSGHVANNSVNVGGGNGGGLSGIFDNSNLAHSAAVLIAGAGGGGSGDSNGQGGPGGGGGGANQNGRDGIGDARISQRTQGLGGTTSGGGAAGNASNSGSYTHTNPTAGSALQGGSSASQVSGQTLRASNYLGGGRAYIATNGNWMGGAGGSGYYGGGGGMAGYAGGGGGGSGYKDSSVTSSVNGTVGNDGSGQSTTAAPENSSTYYASGVAVGGATMTNGGDGRIVLVY